MVNMSYKIDGKTLAQELLVKMHGQVEHLNAQHISPTLAIIKAGDDPSSEVYIAQKRSAAAIVGMRLETLHFFSTVPAAHLSDAINSLNIDPKIHGIIIQLPLPSPLSNAAFSVELLKDVDGFESHSPFTPPVALAVFYVLGAIYQTIDLSILNTKRVLIIGRGATAGKPIADALRKRHIEYIQMDSKTPNSKELIEKADIIISCVGKRRVVKGSMVKKGVVLIGVGITRENGKLYGDFDEKDINSKAQFFTPVPGGIGPLNVAFLMQNVIEAAQRNSL